jgi:glycosyltransferase involved in cell wall biosynthesis
MPPAPAPDADRLSPITVVVPTRNRAGRIAENVSSVLANPYPDFRVLVIDQSDDDRTERTVRALAATDARLRYLRQPGTGAARARNLGAWEAADPLVAFVDDDCVVAPDWLASIAAGFARYPEVDLIYGQVRVPPDVEIGEDHLPNLTFEDVRICRPDRPFVLFGMSANLAVRRGFFERLGGFDEMLGVGAPLRAGEDYDLQYRAHLAGGTIGILPEVRVDHYGLRTNAQWPRTMRDYGFGDAAFYLKHARCGDLRTLGWLVQRVGKVAVRELLIQTRLRPRPTHAQYLIGFAAGVPGSLRVAVDRRRRFYVPTVATVRTPVAAGRA